MRIYLGADHAGFNLKEQVKAYLKEQGHEVGDQGAFVLDEGDDYPDFIKMVAKLVQSDFDSRGIIFGGTGQGEAICANRYPGVRAAVYCGGGHEIVRLSREHNDANILSLGARFLNFDEAKGVIDVWLVTPFSGEERHIRRIKEIDNLDVGNPSLEY